MVGIGHQSGSGRVLLLAAAHDRARLRAAVAACGATVADERDCDGLIDLAEGLPDLVLAAIDDVPAAMLPDVLADIVHYAAAVPGGLVISSREDQIDAVAAVALGTDADILCDADGSVLATAVALSLSRANVLPVRTLRESEAARLRRLNEEIARIAEVLARLAQQDDRRPGGVADRGHDYHAPPATARVAAVDVRKAIRARRLRDSLFESALFEDPAWDVLLDLYAAELEQGQVSVSSLCIAAAVPPTTALRWIGRMTESGLLERRPDDLDRRRAFIGLTRSTREKMDGYFALLAQNGIAIA